jgi:hypothetical protein
MRRLGLAAVAAAGPALKFAALSCHSWSMKARTGRAAGSGRAWRPAGWFAPVPFL